MATVTSLESLTSSQSLAKSIEESPSLETKAIASTVSELLSQGNLTSNSSHVPSFDPSLLTLLGVGVSGAPQLMRKIVDDAQKAALAVPCGSILAGEGSESDDYGDVGVWLGQGEFKKGSEKESAEQVLKALGLTSWANGKVRLFLISE